MQPVEPESLSWINLLPIFISLFALLISGIGIGWTIHRDVRKPHFRVSIAIKNILQHGAPPSDRFLGVEALNVGPIPNKIGFVFVRKSWWQRRFGDRYTSNAMVMADYTHAATSPQSVLAQRIEVGESAYYAFPFDSASFLKEDWVQIGVADGFGQMHWAPREQLAKVRKKFLEEFKQSEADD